MHRLTRPGFAAESEVRDLRHAQRLAYRSRSPLWWCNLAAFYATGSGCVPNLKRARMWYRRAAMAGDSRGMYELGLMYLAGEGGPRNLRAGRKLIARAAQSSEIDALKILAHGLETGAWGFTVSRARAAIARRRLRGVLRKLHTFS